MDFTRFRPEAILREYKALEHVGDHPHIASHLGAFRTKTAARFCFEAWGSGRLFDRLLQRGPLTEAQAREGFRGIGEALEHLHRLGFVHRDLKVCEEERKEGGRGGGSCFLCCRMYRRRTL